MAKRDEVDLRNSATLGALDTYAHVAMIHLQAGSITESGSSAGCDPRRLSGEVVVVVVVIFSSTTSRYL